MTMSDMTFAAITVGDSNLTFADVTTLTFADISTLVLADSALTLADSALTQTKDTLN